MKYLIFTITIWAISIDHLNAQDKTPSLPPEIQQIMNNLRGTFKWEMIRPSDHKILRTGTKSSKYDLDSLILISHETFDGSNIKQTAFFGFNKTTSSFFSVGVYNIDVGPHTTYGKLNKELNRVDFVENDSSRFYLNLVSSAEYFWTYENLKDNKWTERDLKIIFKRINQE